MGITEPTKSQLFDFFVNRVLVAVGTELVKFQPAGGVAAVLGGGVTRHPFRPLVGVGTTLGTFKRDDDTNALLGCHNSNGSY